jgi:hypothetical protein
MLDTAYVITWRYSDGSGSGATAVFTDKARAERLLEILKADAMRDYKVDAVPFDAAPAAGVGEVGRG